MGTVRKFGDIAPGRLPREQIEENFSDLHPPLDRVQAATEADRCFYCFDAPCVQACPTQIDIPLFIRQIAADDPIGAGTSILKQNIMGGMCARACPTEILCEGVCVRNDPEGAPVKIGLLQRYATDHLMQAGARIFERAPDSGHHVAVVGAGPAGLSCAHALACHGHRVSVLEARDKPGGLNEYGIAAYKTGDDFARREVEFILDIGGISIETDRCLGRDFTLADLRRDYDAVFLGLGLGSVRELFPDQASPEGAMDAPDYIVDIRQSADLTRLPVGRRVVVIGGGMTAVDIAVQSRLLGAEDVTMVYRRGAEHMNASDVARKLAQTSGVSVRSWAAPVSCMSEDGMLSAVAFARTRPGAEGGLELTDDRFTIAADVMFRAIGQDMDGAILSGDAEQPTLTGGRIAVDSERKTDLAGVWAGGDCVAGHDDLTVVAVEDGKVAARSIHAHLQERE